MREQDISATKMEERLFWAKSIVEKLVDKKFDEMPIEMQLKIFDVGISMFIQSERSYSMSKRQ